MAKSVLEKKHLLLNRVLCDTLRKEEQYFVITKCEDILNVIILSSNRTGPIRVEFSFIDAILTIQTRTRVK